MIGRTVSHYRILAVLGRGGMGTIYRAEDTRLKRQVALKFLELRPGGGPNEIERLVREAQAASQLDHQNICTIYEIDEVDGEAFIAMACIEGQDLGSRIAAGAMTQEEAVEIARQIAVGLREAHGKGIVHRDIKPANIMLTPKGEVKITDFGLAEMFDSVPDSQHDTTSGTIAYMSPEQLRGEEVDARSDIWSLGVVLYEMLTGGRPFEGDYAQAIVYSALNLEPPPAAELRDDVTPEISRVVSRSLAKRPEDRYQNMDEFLTDLESATGQWGTPGEARRPIAVISFENLTGDVSYDYLERAIPNLLITSLERSQHLRVITWERMRDLLRQLGRSDVETVDRDLGFEASKLEGVHAIVTGSFTKAGDTFATDAKVLDVDTKTLVASSSSHGDGVDSILKIQVDELSRQILSGLDVEDKDAEAIDKPIAELTTASLEAYEHFLKGKDSYERLYNAEARRLLEKAVELDPYFAEAYLYLAWTYVRLRQPADRDEALSKAMSLSGRATRKERLYIEAAHARTVEQDGPKEFGILKQIAREFPGEKLVHHRLAGYHRARGELYQAIEEYNRVLALDPGFGWAMNELVYMYTDIREFEKAAEYFERYAGVSAGDSNPVDSMGELCFRMGRLDEAIAKYRHALELNPDFYYAYWEIAYVSALKEDYTAAFDWIESFIERAPSFGTVAEGHRWRCLYKYWVGQLSEALSDVQLIAELADEEGSELWTAEADRMRAWILYDRNQLKEARGYFESCLAAVEGNPRAFIPAATSYSPGSLDQVQTLRAAHHLALSLLDLREEQPDRARSRLRGVAQAAPDHATLLEGEVLLAEGHLDEAVAVLEAAQPWPTPYMSDTEGMLAHNLPPLKDTLARAYAAKGESFKAIAEYERLTTLDALTGDRRLAHPRYHFRLAKLYESRGWDDRARERYSAFLRACERADEEISEVKTARSKAGEPS
jgi:serine/threonine protein kinase/Tfp pilus assembly protein PilF